ncbi:MAG: helix-turn-helix transcriptional regulator [Clostridia bacterium]|nr:helix-turn-helix transcriptional regulator [Clostridia bacterium]
MMKTLGETIKELRVEKGLTQPQLAETIGVSKGMISIWEHDVNEPKATHVKNLAIALGTSADYLLGLKDL